MPYLWRWLWLSLSLAGNAHASTQRQREGSLNTGGVSGGLKVCASVARCVPASRSMHRAGVSGLPSCPVVGRAFSGGLYG